jgi:hypothetical protein
MDLLSLQSLVPLSFPQFQIPTGGDRATWERCYALLQRRVQELDELRGRSLAWCAVLQALAEAERWDQQYAGFRFATFGFIPMLNQGQESYVFGGAIELGPHDGAPTQDVRSVQVQEQHFPLVINRRSYIWHVANPVLPHPGTGACWARSRRSMSTANEGVLTAEHVIAGTSLGGAVHMDVAGAWTLADSGTCKIDAALVTLSGSIPSSAASLAVQNVPCPGTSVEILGNASPAPIVGNVTHTMIFSTYLSELHPMRVFLDVHGIHGDSGGLVRETSGGPGVGLYMGQPHTPQSSPSGQPVEGICQYLLQAQDALELDLFL